MSATYHDFVRRGVTARRADHWTRLGLIHADNANCGSGRVRTWPWSEVRVAELMAELTSVGVTDIYAAHRLARALVRDGRAQLGEFRIELAPTGEEAAA